MGSKILILTSLTLHLLWIIRTSLYWKTDSQHINQDNYGFLFVNSWHYRLFLVRNTHSCINFVKLWRKIVGKITCLKVRHCRNDFFKLKILPKNERTNSTLFLWYLRLTCFCSFYGRNRRHQNTISKLTDL